MKKNYVLLCKMRPRRLGSPLVRVVFQPEFAVGSWLNYERLAPRQRFCTIQRAIVKITKTTYMCVKKVTKHCPSDFCIASLLCA